MHDQPDQIQTADDLDDEGAGQDLGQDHTGQSMVEGFARVVAVEGRLAWLEIEPSAGCGSCAAKVGCGVPRKLKGRSVQRFALINTFNARPGERVVVGIRQTALLKASAIAYLIPVLAMMAGAVLAGLLGFGDGGAALGAFAGLVAGLAVSFIRARIATDAGTFTPTYLRSAEPGSSLHCGVTG